MKKQFRYSIVLFLYISVVSMASMALSNSVLDIELGGSRHLYVLDDNEVIIKDIRTKKCACFTGARWKRLVSEIDAIDKHVECAMVEKTTAYHQHIGGTWHISVDQLSYG